MGDRIDWEAIGAYREKGDDPPNCLRCGDEYTVDLDAEVGTVCDGCAQVLVEIAAKEILRLRADAGMACEDPCRTCAGCLYAAQRAKEGTL